jgi:hypothetical protein
LEQRAAGSQTGKHGISPGLGAGFSRHIVQVAMRSVSCHSALAVATPLPVALYAFLSLADFGLTLAAFAVGGTEANPALAWFVSWGLFDFAKLASTLLVCCVAYHCWENRLVRRLMTLGNWVMVGVLAHHLRLWLA